MNIAEVRKIKVNNMSSGSITPRVKAHVSDHHESYAKLKNLYLVWERVTQEKIAKTTQKCEILKTDTMAVFSSDMKDIVDAKYFDTLAKEVSEKTINMLQTKLSENLTQLALVQKLLQEWKFFKSESFSENFIFKDCYYAASGNEIREEKLVTRYGINVNSPLLYRNIIILHVQRL